METKADVSVFVGLGGTCAVLSVGILGADEGTIPDLLSMFQLGYTSGKYIAHCGTAGAEGKEFVAPELFASARGAVDTDTLESIMGLDLSTVVALISHLF